MKGDRYEPDLFGDNSYEKKAKKTGFFTKYTPQRFVPHIRIPIEYTIVTLILVLVLIIVAYAVGVEVGKRSLHKEQVINRALSEEKSFTQLPSDTSIEDEVDIEENEPIVDYIPPKEIEEEPLVEKPIVQEVLEDKYVIQLASFKNDISAREELVRIKEMGMKAFIDISGDWYLVRAGGYPTIEEARKAQAILREYYSDCYIRKID